MRFAAVLDGTIGTPVQQARVLGGLVHGGMTGDLVGETLAFYHDDGDRERLVALCPTHHVRLVKATPRRLDQMVDILADQAREGGISLFLFPGGTTGTELATRLACRADGAVLTDAVSVDARADRLICRKNVYSAHLVGHFELSARPWCVSIDAAWKDEPSPTGLEHTIVSDTDETSRTGATPFEDAELVALPSAGDLAGSRFLVVAGYGAGGRAGTDRIAEAARLMGADFGVSRPVAMNGWAPMDRLMGVSGTRAAPAVCIVAGASGTPALHWGIEKAGFIVAINPDEQAPIIRNADAALLDDGVATIEELARIIAAHRGHD